MPLCFHPCLIVFPSLKITFAFSHGRSWGGDRACLFVASLYLEMLEEGQLHIMLVAPPAAAGVGNENRAALAHRRVLGAAASRETENGRTVQSNRYV